MLFRQLFDHDSSTYTYIMADTKTRKAVVIDSVYEQSKRDIALIQELGLHVKYIIDTHIHADHITGSSKLKETFSEAKICVGSQNQTVEGNDVFLKDGLKLIIGDLTLEVLATPGHTAGCISLYAENMVFTGDLLFVRGSGRTDFQSGSNRAMFASVHNKIFTLPNETIVYPGHDYHGFTSSTIGEEKKHNPRLGENISFESFENIMDNLNLPYPKKIDESLPANTRCGDLEKR